MCVGSALIFTSSQTANGVSTHQHTCDCYSTPIMHVYSAKHTQQNCAYTYEGKHRHRGTCIHVHITTYIHMYTESKCVVYVYTYLCTCVHTYVRVYILMYVCTYLCTCVHTYVRVYILMYVCTYLCTCVHIYVRVYIFMQYILQHQKCKSNKVF